MMPSQKLGVDSPHSATTLARVVPRACRACTAETMPAGMPIASAMTIAMHASSSVTGSFSRISVEHRLLHAQRLAEVAVQHAARASTRSARAAARRGAASRAGTRRRSGRGPRRRAPRAGSPGSSCCSPKISIETNSSVGTIVRDAADEEGDIAIERYAQSARGRIEGASPRLRRGAYRTASAQLNFRPCTRTSPSGIGAQARRACSCTPTASGGDRGRRSAGP